MSFLGQAVELAQKLNTQDAYRDLVRALETSLSHAATTEPNIYYYLGATYYQKLGASSNLDQQKGIQYFKQFIQNAPVDDPRTIQVRRAIEQGSL
jgi:hypothetical protein